ncbi:MAG: hypothetical protein Q4G07_10760 [Oscillospiraceae bacterium]|nr:hypothetical protein [Oscillospiraceae bacterium]
MKKVFALLCVCVMVMAMAVPTFAATQGQVDDLAAQLNQKPGNSSAARELAAAVIGNKDVVVGDEVTNAMKKFLVSYLGDLPMAIKTIEGCKVSAYYSPTVIRDFEVSKVSFKDGVLEFTAQFAGGVQSDMGTYLELEMNTVIDASKSYMWECDGQTGKAYITTVGSGDSAYSVVSFYAPHFSTYVITEVKNETPAPTPDPTPEEKPGTETDPSPETNPGTETNPAPTVLANTGADMSFAIFGIVGLGALVVLGSAAALKKRGAKN